MNMKIGDYLHTGILTKLYNLVFMLDNLIGELTKLKNPAKAKQLERFFKTGKGEYGEGDKFLGIMVPLQRQLVAKYKDLPRTDLQTLLNSKIHESRLIALLILVKQYEKGDEKTKKTIVDFYLKNTKNINNWDLVDISSHHILGHYYLDRDKALLFELARSKNLWEKRIAVIATFEFIRNLRFADSLKIAAILLRDKHDLIHKAVGWMLREIGKRDIRIEEEFLQKYYKIMPRTMLRYAIEKFDEKKRKYYLKI